MIWDENSVSRIFDVVVRGPFSDQKIELTEVERKQALMRLVQSFLGSASSYGFSTEEIIEFLGELREEKAP